MLFCSLRENPEEGAGGQWEKDRCVSQTNKTIEQEYIDVEDSLDSKKQSCITE